MVDVEKTMIPHVSPTALMVMLELAKSSTPEKLESIAKTMMIARKDCSYVLLITQIVLINNCVVQN